MNAAPCPTCGLGNGFHDHGEPGSKHDAHTVPAASLVPTIVSEEARRDMHRPYPDDGVTYCGWNTGSAGVIDGCGELWPCTTVRALRAERAGQASS